jgi:DNA-directed RNA polymerase specialized sigma subunit
VLPLAAVPEMGSMAAITGLATSSLLRWKLAICVHDQGRAQATARMDDLTWRELREVLHQELSRLPEKNHLPLILCYLEGKTQEEAARHLGWTPATSRVGWIEAGICFVLA